MNRPSSVTHHNLNLGLALLFSNAARSGSITVVSEQGFCCARAEPGRELQSDGAGAGRDPTGQGATDDELLQAMDPRALWVQVQEAAGQGATITFARDAMLGSSFVRKPLENHCNSAPAANEHCGVLMLAYTSVTDTLLDRLVSQKLSSSAQPLSCQHTAAFG